MLSRWRQFENESSLLIKVPNTKFDSSRKATREQARLKQHRWVILLHPVPRMSLVSPENKTVSRYSLPDVGARYGTNRGNRSTICMHKSKVSRLEVPLLNVLSRNCPAELALVWTLQRCFNLFYLNFSVDRTRASSTGGQTPLPPNAHWLS